MAQTQTPFDRDNCRVLHLEMTTRCNALCPQCDRTDPDSGYSQDHELTVDKLKAMFSHDFVRQLDKVFACGTFGDPAAAKECLDMFRWFRSINPDITLGMNTNGGLRDTRFWLEVADLFRLPRDYVVFSIDGMAATNSVYRVGVQWHRLMMNVESYIRGGGHAQWDMLVFEHNEQDVELCKERARSMGFTHFRTKVSNRFQERPVEFLKQPTTYHPTTQPTGPVLCHAAAERSLYVSATGHVLPCCFFGAEIFRSTELLDWAQNDPTYINIAEKWSQEPHKVCTRNCSTRAAITAFDHQFRQEIAF